MSEKKLLLGDEALALGALHAGLSGVYAYPGTPSTEITEYIQAHPLTKERGIHLHDSPGVRHAGGKPHQYRNMIGLGIVKRLTHHVIGFLLVGRLKARHHCKVSVESGILLVLRGMLRRIIASHDHETTVRSGHRGIDKGIGAHVHPDMLHAHERALTRI